MPQQKNKNSSQKLLVLCQLFYPELVSTGQTLTELCEELAARGVKIEVICGPITVLEEYNNSTIQKLMEYKGILIRRVWGTRFPKLNLMGRVINQITFALSVFFNLFFERSKRPVLVLTNPPFLALSCALLRSMRIGNPYIYLIFDVYPDMPVKLGVIKENGFLARIWELVNKYTYRCASAIVVIGRCMKEVIGRKIDSSMTEKIKTIHVWSDDRLIKPVPKSINPYIEKWGLDGKFAVIYSGNMGRFHDLETIMKAARYLRDHNEIVFAFIGEGHKKQWAIDYANQHQLGNCQFHTYVKREDLAYSLSCADVGLVSLMPGQEGLSVPSKTYGLMAAGVPVVGIMSPVSEIAKMLSEEECGVVIQPGDAEGLANAILNLYDERDRVDMMGKNARNAIDSRYNLRSAANAYYELISWMQ